MDKNFCIHCGNTDLIVRGESYYCSKCKAWVHAVISCYADSPILDR